MLRSLIRILHASLVQIDEKYAKQQHPAAGCVSALMGLMTLIFDF